MNSIIFQNQNSWQRLEDLLEMMEILSSKGLTRAEVQEFGELYRRTASDLAIAREESRDPRLVNYLNNLVIRAHGKIYKSEGEGFYLIWNFISKDLPQTFRKNIRYIELAFGVFILFICLGFFATWRDLNFLNFVDLSGIEENIKTNDQWWRELNHANQIGSSEILTNNIVVTIRVFAMGAFFGVGSFFGLAFEGARLGSIFAACFKLNPPFGNSLATFIIGHGVIEISCIIFCGAAGMMIGYSLINPGEYSRTDAIKQKGVEATKIVIGCAFLLVIAGIIEGFISPSALPAPLHYAVGFSTGIAMYSYFFLVGRNRN